MTNRFTVHNIIKGFDVGHCCDLETLEELIEEYGSSEKIELEIRNDDKCMTYEECCNLLNEQDEKIKELKQFKDKVFALIDARIEIYKHKPFMAPASAPMSVNFDEDVDRLVRLSELQELKKELKEWAL